MKEKFTFKLSCKPQSRVLPSGLNIMERTPVVCELKYHVIIP